MNVWESWFAFRRGKKRTRGIDEFTYVLEEELLKLQEELLNKSYRHGGYRTFTVMDNKRREISVASLRDRVVHRLLYRYLLRLYDKTFHFDVWSCRPNKGLTGAINRTQRFVRDSPASYVWRTDITKFFDHVNRDILVRILQKKISDTKALWLLQEVIDSFAVGLIRERAPRKRGIPIGNLTSQIFANIYLNELDRFVVHTIKPTKRYLRYGDDFAVFDPDPERLRASRAAIVAFLRHELELELNPKHDIIVQAKDGLHFLGVEIFPSGRRLRKRNWTRVKERLHPKNVGSYSGLVLQHSSEKKQKEFHWRVAPFIETP